ncbi:beta-galactosidase [Paenibacillus luteus]|uniref:beta-galactosidase n=1 Tax=Paenibacillus luteus TaxID=2545753 RepID=UPI0011431398|nr:beta-galactosidase [Paenibacillus luteus]
MSYTLGNSELQTITGNTQLHYDAKSFIIGGKRVFLNIASIHYFRMPRQEWREVLVKAKLAGMNCVDTYFAWNVHESEEGNWDFSGDNDCGAFLDLCSELGLWVIARPGPFICAEWDFGGFPYWLKTKEKIQFRTDNEEYLRYVYRYFDQIIPIIHSRQITQNGTVILVQVENEYGYLAGDASGMSYMNGLRDALLSRGIDVPLITCEGGAEGTIEGANFWSGASVHYEKLMRKQPDVPKLVTEFWTGWFEHWGAPAATQKTPDLYEKRLMEVIRAGFDGISHYMFFGGTNFGGYGGRTVGSSDIFMVTSYDYDAPLSEYGRITAKYRTAKKVSLFTQALGEFLLESVPMDKGEARCVEGIDLQGREWNGQKLWFAESNKQEKGVFPVTLGSGRTLSVPIKPGQIATILDRIEVCPGLRLTSGGCLIGNDRLGDVQTLILAGDDGGRTHAIFEADQAIHYENAGTILLESSSDARTLRMDAFHFQTPQRILLKVGGQRVEIITLNGYMSDRAWKLQGDDVRWAIGWEDMNLGADGCVSGVSGGTNCETLLLGNWGSKSGNGWEHQGSTVRNSGNVTKSLLLPSISEWKQKAVNLLALGTGELAESPQGFAELGLAFGYLLYSSDVECDQDHVSTLVFSAIQDPARLFVNGQEQAIIRQVGAASTAVRLLKGHNKLQLLVQHMGSLNFSPYLGEEKGIFGPVYKDGSAVDLRRGWYYGEEVVHLDEVHAAPFASALTRTFELMENDHALLVGAICNGLRINGTEVSIAGYQNWFAYHAVDISAYLVKGSNIIEMPVAQSPLNRLELLTYNGSGKLENWSIDVLDDAVEFDESSDSIIGTGPTWNRSTFDLPEIPSDSNPKLKLRMSGMSKGYLLLNGRNLGRYWQIGPQEDYKIPMAWLKKTGNELILFDEEGRMPDSVRLFYDEQSNRSWHTLNKA